MTPEQQQALGWLRRFVQDAEYMTRRADELAQGDLRTVLEPDTLGHIAIAMQHLQMTQKELQEVTSGRRRLHV